RAEAYRARGSRRRGGPRPARRGSGRRAPRCRRRDTGAPIPRDRARRSPSRTRQRLRDPGGSRSRRQRYPIVLRRIRRPMPHRVTLIPGAGTGPAPTETATRVLDARGVELEWEVRPAGADVMAEHGGNPLPDETLESIRRNRVAFKGPITTPVGEGFRSVNVGLRKSLDL